MNENPVSPSSFIEEHPILEPNLFLLNHANRPLMGWHHEYMILEKSLSNRSLAGLFSMGVFGMISIISLSSFLNLPAPFQGLVSLMSVIVWVIVIGRVIRYLERDIAVKGIILPGIVTHAEKIHTRVNRLIGVRYQFTAPGGIVIEGYDEGDCENASYEMVPAPGRSVYVWYGDDEKHYLL
jgi:hypothetical protein